MSADVAPRVVLTYGRFDLFHRGHMRFLRQIAALGSDLIVGCATDAHAQTLGRPCQMPHTTRRALLEQCRYVTRVIPWDCAEQKRTDIVNYDVSTIAVTRADVDPDQDLHDIAQVLYLPPVTAPEDHEKSALSAAG